MYNHHNSVQQPTRYPTNKEKPTTKRPQWHPWLPMLQNPLWKYGSHLPMQGGWNDKYLQRRSWRWWDQRLLIRDNKQDITLCIMDTIDSVWNGGIPVLQSDDAVAKAAFRQKSMGIRALLNGLWLQDWIALHEEYYKSTRSRKSPRVWLTRLSLLLQLASHEMWKTRNEAIHKREESKYLV